MTDEEETNSVFNVQKLYINLHYNQNNHHNKGNKSQRQMNIVIYNNEALLELTFMSGNALNDVVS